MLAYKSTYWKQPTWGKMRLRAEKAPLSRVFVEATVDEFSEELENIETTSRVNLAKFFRGSNVLLSRGFVVVALWEG